MCLLTYYEILKSALNFQKLIHDYLAHILVAFYFLIWHQMLMGSNIFLKHYVDQNKILLRYRLALELQH